jgi:hypothetical protein
MRIQDVNVHVDLSTTPSTMYFTPMVTTETAVPYNLAGQRQPPSDAEAIHAFMKQAYEQDSLVRLVLASGQTQEGRVIEWDSRQVCVRPAKLNDGVWYGANSHAPAHCRIISAEIIDQPKPSGEWFSINSVTDAQLLDGEMLEVDATNAVGLRDWHGVRGRASFNRGSLFIEAADKGYVIWNGRDAGLRFRFVLQPGQASGEWIEVTTLEQAKALDGKTVEVDASGVTGTWMVRGMHGYHVSCQLRLGPVGFVLETKRTLAVLWSTGTTIGGLRLRLATSASLDASLATGNTTEAANIVIAAPFDPTATFRDAGMRPELVAALARQNEQPQPTSKVCSDCKGERTMLLTSKCPKCDGTGTVAVEQIKRFSYALQETHRYGDQVWRITRAGSLTEYVLTELGGGPSALTTTAKLCTQDGRPLVGRVDLPGSFIGEHHGERAIAGYVEHLNRTANR